MTKLKSHIRENLEPEYVDLLESELVVKLSKEFPGAKVICLQKI
jgi:hypothetical protein